MFFVYHSYRLMTPTQPQIRKRRQKIWSDTLNPSPRQLLRLSPLVTVEDKKMWL